MTHWATSRRNPDYSHISGGITRRRFLKTGATGGAIILGGIALPSIIAPAKGAEKTIKIGMYSSPRTEVVKATIIKRPEEKHRVKFLIDEGWTTDQLARLRATRQNPVHSVMWMDDIGVNIARKEGLIDKLPEDKIPNLSKVFPRYIIEEGYGVGNDISTVVLSYNIREVKERPTSWAALWYPTNQGKVSVPSIAGTHGVNLVVVAAALETGKPF